MLIWQQVVTSVPSTIFGKSMEVGSSPPEPLKSSNIPEDEPKTQPWMIHRDSHNPMQTRRGQILWIRGLTRLQTQIRVVNAFRSGVDNGGAQFQQAASNQRLIHQRQSSAGTRIAVNGKIGNDTDNGDPSVKLLSEANNGSSVIKISSSHTETAL